MLGSCFTCDPGSCSALHSHYRIFKNLYFLFFPFTITFFNLPRLQISVSVTSLIFCIYKKQRGLRFIRSQSHERASLATLDLACGDPRGALARKIQGRSDRGRAWQRAPHPYIHLLQTYIQK